MQNSSISAADHISSYLAWWNDAGVVFTVCDTPTAWLSDVQNDATDFDILMAQMNLTENADAPKAAMPPPQADATGKDTAFPALPTKLDGMPAFYAELSAKTNRRCVLPTGKGTERLCILTDMPRPDDEKSGALFLGEDGALLNNMLAAIGLSRTDAYIFSAIPFHAATPQSYQDDVAFYKSLMRRHLSLLAARHVLIFGDLTSRLLLDKPIMQSRGSLHNVNHDSGHNVTSSCFHPHGLLKRPAYKRTAWQDLLLLRKTLDAL